MKILGSTIRDIQELIRLADGFPVDPTPVQVGELRAAATIARICLGVDLRPASVEVEVEDKQ